MLKPREAATNNRESLINKTNKIINRKIWPLSDPKDQEEWAKELCFQQMINRPVQPRSRSLLRPEGLLDFPTTADTNVSVTNNQQIFC